MSIDIQFKMSESFVEKIVHENYLKHFQSLDAYLK